MRIAFLGSADFSVPALDACVGAGHEVALVVTQPDRPGARGRPAPRPVAAAAGRLGLELWQPPRLRDPGAVERLRAMALDALVVAAYGQILPGALLDGPPGPRLGGLNVHASLLPRWRGASPVAAAILAGDAFTGVCIMRMDAGLDTGPVCERRSVPIPPRTTTPELSARLAELGAAALVEVLARLAAGGARCEPQPEQGVTMAPRLRREDARIDWGSISAVQLDRHVRALTPWPGTVAALAGRDVELLAGAAVERPGGDAPGTVVGTTRTAADVATADGVYRVERVRPPGRRGMDAAAYLRGRPAARPA